MLPEGLPEVKSILPCKNLPVDCPGQQRRDNQFHGEVEDFPFGWLQFSVECYSSEPGIFLKISFPAAGFRTGEVSFTHRMLYT